MKLLPAVVVATLSWRFVSATVSEWGQCGGINYTGDTTCAAGLVCWEWNPYYYQCITPSIVTTSSSTSSSKSSSSSTSSTKTSSSSSTKATSTSSTKTSSTSSTKTSSSTSSSASASSTLAPLHDLAVAAGKQYYGVAVDTNELANATYKVDLDNTHLFGQITPGNKMKWDATEPSRGTFTYSAADAIVTWALGDGKQIRGHTLVWHSQLPSWVTSGNFDNATLVSIVQTHITNLVTHFGDQVKTWDVVNEVLNDDGTWRTSVFYTTIGEYFVDIAFRAAAAANANVGLAANDYNIESSSTKAAAYVSLVNRLKSRGVKITQIGSQTHLIVGSVPSISSLTSIYQSIVATGVDLAITELDIRMTLPATDALLAQQKIDYNKVTYACLQVSKCIGYTVWAYSDYYSWIPSVFSGQGAALPFDDALNPKPAFYGIVDGLEGIIDS